MTCRDKNGQLSVDCKLNLKPAEQQLCRKECESIEEIGLKDQPMMNFQKPIDLVGEEPTWTANEWSSCSADCGQGFQKRIVECKILFKFSGTVAILPDDQCHHETRPDFQKSCFLTQCDEENEIEQETNRLMNKHKNKNHLESSMKQSFTKTNNEESSAIIASPSEPAHSTTLLDSTINEISNRNDDLQSNNFNDFLSSYQWIIAGFTDCTAPCLGGSFFLKIKSFFLLKNKAFL